MNASTYKQLSIFALSGLIACLVLGAQAQGIDGPKPPGPPGPPGPPPPPPGPPRPDDDLMEFVEDEAEDEQASEDEEEFLISIEDSLAQFVIRHRDVRRDCEAIKIDLQIQQQSGSVDDVSLQQEYLGCMSYKRELEENILALVARISQPGPPQPIELPRPGPGGPAEKERRGILSSFTSRLPSIF